MKKILYFAFLVIFAVGTARADCVANDITYTACKPGYYLGKGTCYACPDGGTSPDKNTGGITDCYLSAGTTGTDDTGSYRFTNNCAYDTGIISVK